MNFFSVDYFSSFLLNDAGFEGTNFYFCPYIFGLVVGLENLLYIFRLNMFILPMKFPLVEGGKFSGLGCKFPF